jgi:glycosyltransferase involved in cell wall biosynthesis
VDKKIAFFLPSLVGGGAERVCVNLAAGFLDEGLEVDFVLARAVGPLLKVVPVGAHTLDLSAKRTLAALFPLAAYLRRERPSALIAAPAHANLIAVWAKLLARVSTRVVITVHNTTSQSVSNIHKLQEKLYPFLLRLFQQAAHAIVAVSAGAADDLAQLTGIPRKRITVIYNPVVNSGIDRLKTAPLNHPWFAERSVPVVLAAGRLTVQKDYPTLLRAFAILRQRRPARLVILGEGAQLSELKSLASDLDIIPDLDMLGFVDNPYAFMSRCAVFVLSSAWEGFGIVLVEALACGTQVVSTDCQSGPAEILENGRYGRLVPVGDHVAMAEAIETALDHPLPPEALQARARAFSVESAVKKYLDMLGLS